MATRKTRWRLTVMRTTSRDDIGRGMCGVSGRLSSKSKYISGLDDYTAPRRPSLDSGVNSQLPTSNSPTEPIRTSAPFRPSLLALGVGGGQLGVGGAQRQLRSAM